MTSSRLALFFINLLKSRVIATSPKLEQGIVDTDFYPLRMPGGKKSTVTISWTTDYP
jgi:hypothetical protein